MDSVITILSFYHSMLSFNPLLNASSTRKPPMNPQVSVISIFLHICLIVYEDLKTSVKKDTL